MSATELVGKSPSSGASPSGAGAFGAMASGYQLVPDCATQPGSNFAKTTQDLPVHYTCYACGVCVGTSETLLETREDVVVFSNFYTAESGDRSGAKTVVCPNCEIALGTRGENMVLLRRDRLVKKTERLEILVCSLKQPEIDGLIPLLRSAFPHSNISSRVLLKAELRGFELKGHRPAPDFVVIAHRNEGRALLTDRNGFYHDVLGSAWQHTHGNVLLVLTRTAPKADTDLFDQQLLRSLSTQGDQPTVGAMGAIGRVMTWDTAPSPLQARQLQMLTAKAYYREPTAPAPGIPGQWCRQPVRSASSSMWCRLL